MRPRLLKLCLITGVFFASAGVAWAATVACYGLAFAETGKSHADKQSVWAHCPDGWKVTGGGGDIDGGEPNAVLRASRPVGSSAWGAAGWEVVTVTSTTETAPGVKDATATCPSGKKVTGGGAQISGTTTNVLLRTSRPEGGPPANSWRAIATSADGSTASWSVTAYAVCVTTGTFPDSQVVTASTASDTTSPKTLVVTCPGNKRPLGGGADIGGGSPNQAARDWDEGLVSMAPTFDLSRRWFVSAQAEDAHSTPWSLDLFVICATAPY